MTITNDSNNPIAGVAAAGVVADAEQVTAGSTPQPEPAALHGQDEVIPVLVSLHGPLLASGDIMPVLPPLAPVPAHAPPAEPVANIALNPNLNPNAAPPTLGSLHGIGGIQFADNEMPENPADGAPAGQNDQEPTIVPEHVVPNQAAPPPAPFVQPLAPAMPAVVAQPLGPVADDNPALLRSLHGIEGIQFEDESEDDD
ncbi:hypothetical protein FRC10_011506 [Ceratobasidium sp. 414]|nr:hypothetical protein FRC10_011506 [Ceratobasidium sp. 414]